ncbi:putative O-methyltransferase domain, plant methyltransferase dimerization [Helianthus annuus]|nr:putative O-methyltransferase domain, plant methyltransferase dimerization [Helianthus annuus]KAJ0726090.1 putative O-methyltransferase domain, plant methyltransferase dimerization [Helianthus annuus]KAJ0867158.1 putative O-methyltransferase domain, plant methyltransferase dimerization [Helianthus annuus]
MGSESKIEIHNLKDEEVAAQEEIWNIILGFTRTAVVKCAIELGIPDILENRESPMTLADLASELKCSQALLYRIMRFLIHYKVFQEKPVSKTCVGYTQTPLSRLLTRNGKHSMADLVLVESTPVMLAPWHKLSAWVLGNEGLPFEAAHGKDLWGFCAENPSHSKLFNDGMACDARAGVAAVIGGCPEVFEGVGTLVDVGGGDGTALRSIVEACPWIKGINFDLPHVVSVAPVSVGVEHVGGNMFDHVPKADAVYIMKVLHDWADDDCIAILRKCREAIPQDTGKVIIVDAIVGREEDHEFKGAGLLLDMAMMAHTSDGKERTSKEWSYVFHEAGFTRYTIKHIRAYQSVIEVYP